MIDDIIVPAADQLRAKALERIRDTDGRARVEDYICVLASVCGEAVFMAAGFAPMVLRDTSILPGQPVFGDSLNRDLDKVYKTLTLDSSIPVPALEELYEFVAASVGGHEWGSVSFSVPDGNIPTVLPMQMAYELRPTVRALDVPPVLMTTRALADGLKEVATAIDARVVLTLALEIVFGIAKTKPMTEEVVQKLREAQAD